MLMPSSDLEEGQSTASVTRDGEVGTGSDGDWEHSPNVPVEVTEVVKVDRDMMEWEDVGSGLGSAQLVRKGEKTGDGRGESSGRSPNVSVLKCGGGFMCNIMGWVRRGVRFV